LACNAVVIGQFLKDIFKVIFGRYWPATFVCNNPSLVSNHVYGFQWFKSGSAYASFPSGHTTFIFSFSISMWFLFPKLRWLWFLLAFLVVVGQIGMYYHFLSDVIAGALLGSLVGFYIIRRKDVQ
jgi:membrane-associated phospholipid phosphatase